MNRPRSNSIVLGGDNNSSSAHSHGSTGYFSKKSKITPMSSIISQNNEFWGVSWKSKLFTKFCSIKLLVIIFVSLCVISVGLCVWGINFYYNYNQVREMLDYKQTQIVNEVESKVNGYLNKGKNVVGVFEQYYNSIDGELIESTQNSNVMLFNNDDFYHQTFGVLCKSYNFLSIRYSEPFKAINVYVSDDDLLYASFNADGSIYTGEINEQLDLNLTNFNKIPYPPYNVSRSDWFSEPYESKEEYWNVYFWGGAKKAISYSKPLFHEGTTNIKSIINVAFLNEFTQLEILNIRNSDKTEIILFEANGDLITSTFTSIPYYYEYLDSRNRTAYAKVNALDQTNEIIRDVYLKLLEHDKNSYYKIHGYYVNFEYITTFDSEDQQWVIALLLDTEEIDGSFYKAIIYSSVAVLTCIALVVIITIIFGILFTNCLLRPFNKRMKKILRLELREFKSLTFVVSEFSALQVGIQKFEKLLKDVTQWVKPVVIEHIIYDTPLEKNNKWTTLIYFDIENFVGNTQNQGPVDVRQYINGFIKFIDKHRSAVLSKHGIDIQYEKYVGDAGIYYSDDEESRKNCTVFVNGVLNDQELWKKYRFRVGMSFGESKLCVIGNEVKQLTMLSEAMNLGARLEQLNKKYETTVLATNDFCGASKEWCFVDKINDIKGIDKSISLYTLLSKKEYDAKLVKTMEICYSIMETNPIDKQAIKDEVSSLMYEIPFFQKFKKKYC